MIEVLNQLSGAGQTWLWAMFFVFLRVSAAMFMMPVFGESAVPQRVKLAVAIALSAIVMPSIEVQVPPFAGARSFMPLGAETIIGLSIGLALRLFIMAVQIAGTMAAQATSLSQFFGGAGAEPQPAISQIMMVSALALAAAGHLHVRIAELFIRSYSILPPGQFPDPADLSRWGLAQIAQSFTTAFMLAAPFMVAALIYNVAIGVINRAMPQLMVSFIGAPALTLGGLVLLMTADPVALQFWANGLQTFLAAPFAGIP